MLNFDGRSVARNDEQVMSQWGPREGTSVARLARESPTFENGFGSGTECGELTTAEIRLEICKQGGAQREAGEEFIGNLLPAEIPKHSPQFIIFVETNSVIDGKELVRAFLEEDVPTFAIRIITKQVEEDNGFEEFLVVLGKVKVVIFEVVLDILLERTRSMWTILTKRGEWHKVKTETLADNIRSDFALRQRVTGEIPERLLAARGFVDRWIGRILIMYLN